ncbi:hypothetical protein [Corynebacterium pygosceleis]|uniref:hypothetical protein n=1 Tax=Corynebacterium pygosceleis TaxID=2800406 RepID=UPI0019089F9B|nr:hypothetical protein [Corynebacterium pygosceleis]MCK7675507.1 hypothetical protein [Corynebacterium pygosceleis]MCL0121099.1 hypothetical protein [Corynebacterium pygosceleis]
MTDTNGRDGSNGRGDQLPGGTGGGRDPWGDVPPESDVFAHDTGSGRNPGSDPEPTRYMTSVGPAAAGARAPQHVPPAGYTTVGPRKRGAAGVVIGFLVVVIIAALSVVALGFTVLGWGDTGGGAPKSPETPAVVDTGTVTTTPSGEKTRETSSPSSTTAEEKDRSTSSPSPSPSTESVTDEAEKTTSSESTTERSSTKETTERSSAERTTTKTTKTTTKKPRFSVPDGATGCGDSGGSGVYAGTDVTSCGFAMNVGKQIAGQGGNSSRSISAVSPVTGKSYRMKCSPKGAGAWVCRGGDNAVVYVSP